MLELVKFLVGSIAKKPEAITVDSQTDGGMEIITLGVADEDMGRVIGRGGKIISAIRELIKVKALKSGKRVKLILKDPRQTDQFSPSAQLVTPPQNSKS